MRQRKNAYSPYGGRKKRVWLRVLLCLLLVAVLCFGALEGYIALHSRTQVAQGEDAPELMVLFGCQVKESGPSVLLRDRLETALDYLKAHPDLKVVVTGGKGDDEHISEAQCMYDYLTARGIAPERVLMEDQSRNTWQNIQNTKALLASEPTLSSARRFLLVSSGFHLSRIRLLWDRAWDEPCALSTLAAPVSHTPSRVQMFFREPLALVKSFLLDR